MYEWMKYYELYHHGILGMRWGKRNGPPYPLSGGDYSKSEFKEIKKARLKKNSIYNKKHFDTVIKEGTNISTLSYDKNRTKDTDMFYGTHTFLDKQQYRALFNSKVPRQQYDDAGNVIGTGKSYKYDIRNKAIRDLDVASEDSASKEFINLYKTDRDFYNYITDPKRMRAAFNDDKLKFKGYKEADNVLKRIQNGDTPTESDLKTIYRLFNYTLPFDGQGNESAKNDSAKQRAKFFSKLSSSGYEALLDTNDAIYGGFKAENPVIVFDMNAVVLSGVSDTNFNDKIIASLALTGRKALGI